MTGVYELNLGDRQVGHAEVSKDGLYYRFRCRCRLQGDTLCRVFVGETNLGVLIPDGDEYQLETRIPVSRMKNGMGEFSLQPSKPVLLGKFVPIKPEEPFAYISRLKEAHLTWQKGQIGIVIQEKAGT